MLRWFVVLGVVTAITNAGACPTGWEEFGTSCYGFGDTRVSWPDAQAICRRFGGYLAEVTSEAENEFLKNIARARNYQGLWLGGVDMFDEGHFQWSRTKGVIGDVFQDWQMNEPNDLGGNEDCLELAKGHEYRWNDLPCLETVEFVCEKK